MKTSEKIEKILKGINPSFERSLGLALRELEAIASAPRSGGTWIDLIRDYLALEGHELGEIDVEELRHYTEIYLTYATVRLSNIEASFCKEDLDLIEEIGKIDLGMAREAMEAIYFSVGSDRTKIREKLEMMKRLRMEDEAGAGAGATA